MSEEVQKRLEERKIPVKGRFINTKRADAHIVSDKEHIFTLDEIEKQYDKIDVVMGHGHYEKRGDPELIRLFIKFILFRTLIPSIKARILSISIRIRNNWIISAGILQITIR